MHPNASEIIYQDLAKEYSAVEPPIWAALLANHVRTRGFKPEIIDCEAMAYSDDIVVHHIKAINPRLIVMVVYGQQPSASSQNMQGAVRLTKAIKNEINIPIMFVGIYPSALPRQTLQDHPEIDFVATGEGVYTISQILEKDIGVKLEEVFGLGWRHELKGIIINPPASNVKQEDLAKDLPGMAWDLLPMSRYRTALWHALPNGANRQPFASLYTSLGCPFSCLRGDTLINTIYGKIPIKELAEKYKEIPVYTYDFDKKEVLFAKAINIQKTSTNEELIRVHFDDGTHIDCTPDHKFITFKRGIKNPPDEKIEAQNLQKGMSVRALKFYTGDYVDVFWGRRKSKKVHRLIMEYLLARKLTKLEQVHHKDHNRHNNHPDNLQLFATMQEHFDFHVQEWSERMKKENPAFKMTDEWRKKIGESVKGKKRTEEQKVNYRNSKLGKNNPNFKDGKSPSYKRDSKGILRYGKQRDDYKAQVNHKVLFVEKLDTKEDVYCMEVPNYGWFFANDVLVKNCTFCCINAPFGGSSFRYWPPEFMIEEFDKLHKMGITNIKIADEMFVMKPDHFMRLCQMIIDRGYKFNIWCYARVDITKPQYLETLKKAGVNWLALGIESGNKGVRKGVIKGRFDDVDIRQIVANIRSHGINVIGNYIFGLPDDTLETMQETLSMAMEMNTEEANFYSCMAYPGSKLHKELIDISCLPDTYAGYSQHSYLTKPLPTKTLTAAQVLEFRDKAWMIYHTNPKFLEMIRTKFGEKAYQDTVASTKIVLKRKLLENEIQKV